MSTVVKCPQSNLMMIEGVDNVPFSIRLFHALAINRTYECLTGQSFLIREAENANALARTVAAGPQKMEFSGRNRGKWVDQNGRVVSSENFRLFQNGSVLLKHARPSDAGTYQKDPNPMIRIGDMGYAPPILIIQVQN
ncbi:hypothetical protein B9Z55_007243 [Caenorhabditis nigoni]|uniref:Uncharacterized protein n=1 Tax=Caenorhabditis nigoni TaxID=1611254 RepID=A0A2G5V8M7_9PELO|nr:hypothetical protein B9Z55_007243 [Caenorhabditis nigoni]